MSAAFVSRIDKHFAKVADPRVNRGRNYPLVEMVFVALCGAICDCNAWVDVAAFGRAKLDWFRKFLPFEFGIPAHDTFTEVFARLDTIELYAVLESWAHSVAHSLKGEPVAFDGKTLRGSFDSASGKSALHSVSAWVCGLKLCLAFKSVEDKSNEIPAVQQLLDLLDLLDAVVTADAMHRQRETVNKLISKDADYVLTVKCNQRALEGAVQQALIQAFETDDPQLRQCHTKENNRDRRKTRQAAALPVPKNSAVFARWVVLHTIGSIYRTREIDGRVQEAQGYFISSLSCQVRAISRHLRAHWSIENALHHVLDVTLPKTRAGFGTATARKLRPCFVTWPWKFFQQDTTVKATLRSKRKICGWDEPAFEDLMAGFSAI